ncbi:hypothetical protein C5708_17065 [Caulobacter sp. CCUG 60055]|uniref:hypothetical protein n=1 Tax=Caulobacter sp. CCUG 60055 TaxID=2100090 RepID=UPI001FA7B9DC|nr:hypothetical protein [Caulobacter sp. CCUG 60055]MBQ1541614.1 hypothetical protein [Caulobacteraceae bacterium]MCI3181958.1 hypothetical protein [Caulobacter sp. CCUG 60055]
MTDPIGPVARSPVPRRKSVRGGRRVSDVQPAGEAEADPQAASGLPIPVSPVRAEEPTPAADRAAPVFAAHLLGQGQQKRGLRGGPETLEQARSSYLKTEWSGPADRRARKGRLTKTDV